MSRIRHSGLLASTGIAVVALVVTSANRRPPEAPETRTASTRNQPAPLRAEEGTAASRKARDGALLSEHGDRDARIDGAPEEVRLKRASIPLFSEEARFAQGLTLEEMRRLYGLVDGDLFYRRIHQLGVLMCETGVARHNASVLLRIPSLGQRKSFDDQQIASLVEQMKAVDESIGLSKRVQDLKAITNEAAQLWIGPPLTPKALEVAGRAASEGRGLMDLIWFESGKRVGRIMPGDYPPRDAAVRDVLLYAIAMEHFVIDWACRQP